jgi:hypothetical protein
MKGLFEIIDDEMVDIQLDAGLVTVRNISPQFRILSCLIQLQ